MTTDTTTPSYWLNWRFLLCAIWVSTTMVISSMIIWKCEGFNKIHSKRRENQQGKLGSLYKDEAWKTCIKQIHPVWLLAFRSFAFIVLLAVLTANIVIDGGYVFYFYTQWSFTLVTIYFAIGTVFSIYGCCQYHKRKDNHVLLDTEHGSYAATVLNENPNNLDDSRSFVHHNEPSPRNTAGLWGYIFQITFQLTAGATMLTDCVFWLIIYPFLTDANFRLNFLMITMHSINAIFLLGDTLLNCLRFPFFRIAYFILWTGIYVIFQWIIHACVSLWWPYPFLDLSSSYAPIWYFGVGLIHIPCYTVFTLIYKMKHFLLGATYQGLR